MVLCERATTRLTRSAERVLLQRVLYRVAYRVRFLASLLVSGFKSDARWFEAHHAYYAGEPSAIFVTGQSYLRISELMWDADGWPASSGP